MKVARFLACLGLFAGAFSLLPTPAAAQSLVTVYSHDFETDVGDEWSKDDRTITPNGVRTFLGEFGGESVTLDLWDLPEHCSVTITFDLLIINTWEGSVGWNAGPDIWELEAFSRDDCCPVESLLYTTFANCTCRFQAYPDQYPDVHNPGLTRADEVNTLGYFRDSVYYLSFTFFHDMDDLTFRFAATPNLEWLADESWGIDNLVVQMDTEGTYCCRATRELPIAYGGGVAIPVEIDVTLNPRAQAHVIEESPPSGWSVDNINDGGVWEASTRTIKWGPFFGTQSRTLTYLATPPNNPSSYYTFSGSMIVDGGSEPVCGDDRISRGSHHPADLDSDYDIEATEFTAYGAAWRRGDLWSREPIEIPADYVTNAGVIWKGGEDYRYSPADAPPWVPRTKTATAGSGTISSSFSASSYEQGTPLVVTLSVKPGAGTTAYAVEDVPPIGWVIADISHQGNHDIANGKVKWGVFFDDEERTLSYTVIPGLSAAGLNSFDGLGSFDGSSFLTTGHRYLGPGGFTGHELLVPASAHLQGNAGTDWRSDLGIHNRGTDQATYTIALLKSGLDNTTKETITFTLNPGMSVRYDDVLGQLFDFTGTGALLITASSEDLIVTSRTYTISDDGTIGQSIPGERLLRAITTGQEVRLVQLSNSIDPKKGYRTNIGFASVSETPITVTVDFYNRQGTYLDSRTIELQPYEFRQENRILSAVADYDLDDAYATVRSDTPEARFFTYASVVDNTSNDSVFRQAY